MKRDRKRYGEVALLMGGILAVSLLLTALGGGFRQTVDKKRLVASFYPTYIAVRNLAQGIEDVEVVSLTGVTTGCLHDYQLSPDDRVTLAGAEMLLINGGGAEAFLDDVIAEMPALPVVDASAGIELLPSGEAAGHEEHEGHTHAFYNEHIWTSPARYAQQVENLRDGLCRFDPEHAALYQANADRYLAAIRELEDDLKAAADRLPYRTAITFHSSMAYLVQDWGLPVAAALSIGEEGGVAAADLAEAERQARAAGSVLLLYDAQYPVEYAYVGNSAAQHGVLTLDTAVSGPDTPTAWLDAMRANIDKIDRLVTGGDADGTAGNV